MRAVLQRLETGDQGTFGELTLEGRRWFTAELPWRDNQRGQSCIPAGTYRAYWRKSPRLSRQAGTDVWTYCLRAVPNRSEILIHAANFAGDELLGWRAELDGCIAPGKKLWRMVPKGFTREQRCVLSSKDALREFHALTQQRELELEIRPMVQEGRDAVS